MVAPTGPFPERVGSYELLAPIGAGGMATVYLGTDVRQSGLRGRVAIKLINALEEQDADMAAVLLREARVAARIRHPNVVHVIDTGQDSFGFFLVMDYVEGDNMEGLRRLARRRGQPIPPPVMLRILTDALSGLHAAHELRDETGRNLGLVHRDFSPQNILVGTDGITRLTDFGIAKSALTQGGTRTGQVKGKIGYMAPEQARGKPLDQRADVWAAGVVIWEFFADRRLYSGKDDVSTLLQIIGEEPTPLSAIRPDLPESIHNAVTRALRRDVNERCPSAEQLRRQLLMGSQVADATEVASYVRGLVADKLAERERRVEEIRRLRGRLGELSSVSNELPSPGAVNAAAQLGVGADGTVPEEDELTTQVVSSRDAELQSAPTVARARTAGMPQWLFAVGAAVLIFVVVIGVTLSVRSGQAERPLEIHQAAASKQVPPVLAPTPSVAPAPVQQQPDEIIVVHSNVPLKSLRVADEQVHLPAPAERVELAAPKPGTMLRATAVDGRVLRAEAPAAGQGVKLRFPPRRSSGAQTPRVPTRSENKAPSFAGNPYN